MTLGGLANLMEKGFKDSDKRTNDKIDNLARITAKGFSEVHTEINDVKTEMREGFKQVNKRFEKVDQRFEQIDGHFLNVDARLDRLEMDMTELRKEVRFIRDQLSENISRYEYKQLEKRLHKIEIKLGLS